MKRQQSRSTPASLRVSTTLKKKSPDDPGLKLFIWENGND